MPTTVTWTIDEDARLKELVEEYGQKRWSFIANKIGSKGSKQCRRRWKNYLIGDIKSGGWNADEDAALIEAHRMYGNRWTEIAKLVHGRTDNAVKNRWAALCRKDPTLADEHAEPSPLKRVAGKRRQRDSMTFHDTSMYEGHCVHVLHHQDAHMSRGYADTTAETHDTSWEDGPVYGGGHVGDHAPGDNTCMHVSRIAIEYLGPQIARQLYSIDPTMLTNTILNAEEGMLGPSDGPGSPLESGSTSSPLRPNRRMLEAPIASCAGPGLITSIMNDSQRDMFYERQHRLRALNIANIDMQHPVDVNAFAMPPGLIPNTIGGGATELPKKASVMLCNPALIGVATAEMQQSFMTGGNQSTGSPQATPVSVDQRRMPSSNGAAETPSGPTAELGEVTVFASTMAPTDTHPNAPPSPSLVEGAPDHGALNMHSDDTQQHIDLEVRQVGLEGYDYAFDFVEDLQETGGFTLEGTTASVASDMMVSQAAAPAALHSFGEEGGYY